MLQTSPHRALHNVTNYNVILDMEHSDYFRTCSLCLPSTSITYRTLKRKFILQYIHTYIHTYMHTCIHTCIHAYIHTYIHTYYIHTTYMHTTYMHTCIHTYIHTYNYVFLCVLCTCATTRVYRWICV
jgi:hypothetical protein